jgi:hypothetical protein
VHLLRIAAVVFALGLAHSSASAQECAPGPAPTCAGTCPTGSVCAAGQSGTPCECVPGTELAVTKLGVKLGFAKPQTDNVQVKAQIPVPAGFVVAGRMVRVDVGGIARTFVLDDRGKAMSDGAQLKFAVKTKRGVVEAQDAKLSFKASNGDFQVDLADEGLVNATIAATSVTVRIDLTLDGHLYAKPQVLAYKAKQGKTGKASLPK